MYYLSINLIIYNARNFDRTNISDTSDIRITIYDIYIALVENNIIQIEHLSGELAITNTNVLEAFRAW